MHRPWRTQIHKTGHRLSALPISRRIYYKDRNAIKVSFKGSTADILRLKYTHSSDSSPPLHTVCTVKGLKHCSPISFQTVSLSLSPTDPLSSEQCVRWRGKGKRGEHMPISSGSTASHTQEWTTEPDHENRPCLWVVKSNIMHNSRWWHFPLSSSKLLSTIQILWKLINLRQKYMRHVLTHECIKKKFKWWVTWEHFLGWTKYVNYSFLDCKRGNLWIMVGKNMEDLSRNTGSAYHYYCTHNVWSSYL